MSEENKDINIIELLIGIKEDVSSIKTDMANFKESQRVERENTVKEITEVRNDCAKSIADLETRLSGKISNLQSVQNNLVGEVDLLKNAEDKKDAKRWKTVITYVCTSVGSIILVKIPDFIAFCLKLSRVE